MNINRYFSKKKKLCHKIKTFITNPRSIALIGAYDRGLWAATS